MIDGAIAHRMVEIVQVNHPTNETKMSKQNHDITRIIGIVHLKMKILSPFTHPYTVPNPYNLLPLEEHRKMAKKMNVIVIQ